MSLTNVFPTVPFPVNSLAYHFSNLSPILESLCMDEPSMACDLFVAAVTASYCAEASFCLASAREVWEATGEQILSDQQLRLALIGPFEPWAQFLDNYLKAKRTDINRALGAIVSSRPFAFAFQTNPRGYPRASTAIETATKLGRRIPIIVSVMKRGMFVSPSMPRNYCTCLSPEGYEEVTTAILEEVRMAVRAFGQTSTRDRRKIPASKRTKPMSLKEAARLIGFGKGRDAAERLRAAIDNGTVRYEKLTRQQHIFSLDDFHKDKWPHARP